MRTSRKSAASANLFVSAKTGTAIPAGSALSRDLLIQASLDTRNHRLDFVSSVNVGGQTIRLDAVIATRDDGRYALDLVEARPLRDLDGEGLVLLAMHDLGVRVETVTAAHVRREPRLSGCREIWAHREVRVSTDDRAQILEAIEMEGPMSVWNLEHLVHTRGDATAAIYSMACDATLDIHMFGSDLGEALVRAGRHAVRHPAMMRLA